MTVGEMLERMDSSELSEWMALYRIETAERKSREPGGGSTTTFGSGKGTP